MTVYCRSFALPFFIFKAINRLNTEENLFSSMQFMIVIIFFEFFIIVEVLHKQPLCVIDLNNYIYSNICVSNNNKVKLSLNTIKIVYNQHTKNKFQTNVIY